MEEISLSGWTEPAAFRETRSVLAHIVLAVLAARRDLGDNAVANIQIKQILNTVAWATTVPAEKHKYEQRFISAGARRMFEEFNNAVRAGEPWAYAGERKKWHGRMHPMKCVEHDHVQGRGTVVSDLLASGGIESRITEILAGSQACVVTVEEHRDVGAAERRGARAWDRYTSARVAVWDRALGDWKIKIE